LRKVASLGLIGIVVENSIGFFSQAIEPHHLVEFSVTKRRFFSKAEPFLVVSHKIRLNLFTVNNSIVLKVFPRSNAVGGVVRTAKVEEYVPGVSGMSEGLLR
jgi:hypothetical protein